MEYLGNFKHWIKPEYIDYIMNNEGVVRPKTLSENPDSPEFRKAAEVGYDLNSIMWRIYEDIATPLDIKSPIPTTGEFNWWFIKLMPGNFMPMHRDPHVTWDDGRTRDFSGGSTGVAIYAASVSEHAVRVRL